MYKLVLLRHGESTWNKKGLFTGWVDVGLTKKGEQEAKEAGRQLRRAGFSFDLAFTSKLRRAAKTLRLALQELGQAGIPTKIDWRLNERHYGNLQGLSKQQMAAKFGEEQVFIWRRSYSVRPPQIARSNKFNQQGQAKYRGIKVPTGESLEDVVARVRPFWSQEIIPFIKAGRKVVISASGNSLRAIVKHLDKISDKKISGLDIPTGLPLVYELDDQLRPRRHYYLADPKTLRAAIAGVKNQGKK